MRLTSVFSASAALGMVVGAAVVVLSPPARAADDELPVDQKVYRSIMEGLGFKRDGEATINYQERGPLVLPPNRDLPPPERSDAAITNNPSWPKDPDVMRRKAEAMEKDRNISDEREREQNPLRPDQLAPGGRGKNKKQQAAKTDDGYDAPSSGFGSQLLPSQLGSSTSSVWGAMFGNKKEETARFTGEPPRASLTEPPAGYQTPSPDQPYGLGKAPQKPTDYYTSHSEPSR